jgi:beta-lactamase class A
VVTAHIRETFDRADCTGQLCVQSLDGGQEVAVDADRPAVSASVFKVCVALEAETQFADGRLDPRQRVTLRAADRTPGPVGFSLFRDDAEASPHTADEEDHLLRRLMAAEALMPERTTRTTPRDMATLLRLIWTDRAGPPPACRRVRELMGQQLTRHRLAAGFPPPARVSAKSGSLVGIVRNEIGVTEYPDGPGYAAAVFVWARQPWRDDAAINTAIGAAAAGAVGLLRSRTRAD